MGNNANTIKECLNVKYHIKKIISFTLSLLLCMSNIGIGTIYALPDYPVRFRICTDSDYNAFFYKSSGVTGQKAVKPKGLEMGDIFYVKPGAQLHGAVSSKGVGEVGDWSVSGFQGYDGGPYHTFKVTDIAGTSKLGKISGSKTSYPGYKIPDTAKEGDCWKVEFDNRGTGTGYWAWCYIIVGEPNMVSVEIKDLKEPKGYNRIYKGDILDIKAEVKQLGEIVDTIPLNWSIDTFTGASVDQNGRLEIKADGGQFTVKVETETDFPPYITSDTVDFLIIPIGNRPVVTDVKQNDKDVTVTAIDDKGIKRYGYGNTDNCDSVSNWQTSNVFTNVTPGRYYFYAEDTNLNISSGKEFTVLNNSNPVSIEIKYKSGDRDSYLINEAFNSNLEAIITYSDSSTKQVSLTEENLDSFSTSARGSFETTGTIEGISFIYKYDVAATISKIEVKEVETEYGVGEEFKQVGKVVVTYSDGNTEESELLSSMLSGFSTATEGKKTVTVTAFGKTTTYDINVIQKETPVTIDVDVDDTIWEREKVGNVTSTGEVKHIELPTGSKVYTNVFNYMFLKNGSYTFSALGKDNKSADSKVVNITHVDNEAPRLMLGYNASFDSYTVNAIDNVGIKRVIMPDGTEVTADELPLKVPFEINVPFGTFTAEDLAGNTSTKEMQLNYTDIGTGDKVFHTFVGLDGIPTDWTNQSAKIRVAAFSDEMDVDEIKVYEDGKEPVNRFMNIAEEETKETEEETEKTEEETEEETKETEEEDTEDTEEEEETEETEEETEEETKETEEEDTEDTEEEEEEEETEETKETEELSSKDIVVQAFSSKLRVDVAEKVGDRSESKPKYKEYTVDENGKFGYTVINRFGQYVNSFEVNKIDKVKPVIEVEQKKSRSAEPTVSVTIKVTDDSSGIRIVSLPDGSSINEGSDEVLDTEKSIELTTGTYKIQAKDYAGNIAEYSLDVNVESGGIDTKPVEPGVEDTYTVTFDGNNSFVQASYIKVSKGDSCNTRSIDRDELKSYGKEFKGWNTQQDGQGNVYKMGEEITPSDNMTLYLILEDIETSTPEEPSKPDGGSSSGGSSSGGSSSGGSSSGGSSSGGSSSDTNTSYDWFYSKENIWYMAIVRGDNLLGNTMRGWYKEKQDNKWYYLDEKTGAMKTGWQNINGKWYYFEINTQGQTYFGDNKRGWKFSSDKKIKPHGAMYVGESTPDGYEVDSNGVLIQK